MNVNPIVEHMFRIAAQGDESKIKHYWQAYYTDLRFRELFNGVVSSEEIREYFENSQSKTGEKE